MATTQIFVEYYCAFIILGFGDTSRQDPALVTLWSSGLETDF